MWPSMGPSITLTPLKTGSAYLCAAVFFSLVYGVLGERQVDAELKIEFPTSLVINVNVQRVVILLRKREVSAFRKSHIY